jgi:hypothetical protein
MIYVPIRVDVCGDLVSPKPGHSEGDHRRTCFGESIRTTTLYPIPTHDGGLMLNGSFKMELSAYRDINKWTREGIHVGLQEVAMRNRRAEEI